MLKLYEITTEYDKLLGAIWDNNGEISDHIGASLDEVNDEFKTKVLNIAKMIKNLEGEQAAFKAEGQRLQKKASSIGNNIEWLKNYIKDGMERMQTNEVKGEILTIKTRPSPESCIILDDKIVPAEFTRIIPETVEINKKACIAYYKESNKTKIVPGTEIGVGTTLTIR